MDEEEEGELEPKVELEGVLEVDTDLEARLETVAVCAAERAETIAGAESDVESGAGSVSKSVPPVYLMPHGDFTDIRVCMSDDRLFIPEM